MNSRPMCTFRQFWSVENFRSWLSYSCTAISVSIVHQVGEYLFDRQSGEGVALQSSMPRVRRVRACRSMQRGHSGDLRRS
jgi:hypothetical protein